MNELTEQLTLKLTNFGTNQIESELKDLIQHGWLTQSYEELSKSNKELQIAAIQSAHQQIMQQRNEHYITLIYDKPYLLSQILRPMVVASLRCTCLSLI